MAPGGPAPTGAVPAPRRLRTGRDRRLVLALDVGTSSVRAILFDEGGRAVPGSEVRAAYRPRLDAKGAVEVTADQLFDLCVKVLDRAVSRARVAGEIGAVGVSAFWHSLLGTDAGLRPVTSLMLWSDTRAWRQAERLRRELDAEAVRQRTGCPVHPSYWPAKLAWLRDEDPGTFARARHWLNFGDYLHARLFGSPLTSPSMASGTGLRRLGEGDWDPDLLDRLGVPAARLPAPQVQQVGLQATWAARWPALARVPWGVAAGDGGLANLGSGCTGPERRALTLGTSGALRVTVSGRPAQLGRGLWCYVLDENRHVVGGALSNAGNLFAWLQRTLRLPERGLDARLGRMAPAASGLTFVPLLAGERSLGWAARASGAIAGLTQATTALELTRAGMEAVAMRFAAIDEALEGTVPGPGLLVGSGHALASSPAWAQMIADACGRPLQMAAEAEASARGAALLALERLGVVRARPSRGGRTFQPRAAAHAAYGESYRRQGDLYEALIQEWRPATETAAGEAQ